MTVPFEALFGNDGPPPAIAGGGGFHVAIEDLGPPAWDWRPDGADGRWRAVAEAGVEAVLAVRRVPARHAAVVTCSIRNTAEAERILTACAVRCAFVSDGRPWRVTTCSGGTPHAGYPSANFEIRERSLLGPQALSIGTGRDGRSSNDFLPMVIVARDGPDAAGFWCGLEWSGEWFLDLENGERDGAPALHLRAGVPIRRLVLAPGEELALPPVHLGLFAGDAAAGTNALRRYVFESVQPLRRGGPPHGAVSYCSWSGLHNDLSATGLVRQARRAAELGIEVFEVDAGWFGDFPDRVGDWDDVDRARFPAGLEPVAERVRDLGMDFGLWFEPERSMAGTWAQRTRPDLFWPDPAGRPEYHLDLSRRDAQDWALGWMSGWIARLGARWIRYDCNLASGIYFTAQDWTRKVQFGYVAGLYRVLDELRRRHPDLTIENCASGGRRMDLGTLARSHTSWFSDFSHDAHTCRCMVLGAQRFLPGNCCNSGIGHRVGAGAPADIDLEFLSRIIGKISLEGDLASLDAPAVARYRHWIDTHRRTRHLVVQDHFRLTPVPAGPDDWDVGQWASYDRAEGLLACFRLSGAPSRRIDLADLDRGARYRLTDLGDGGAVETTGTALMDGWQVDLGDRHAGLWHWERR